MDNGEIVFTNGTVSTLAASQGFRPWGLTLDSMENIIFSIIGPQDLGPAIYRIISGEPAKLLAGTGSTGCLDGLATEASFLEPRGIEYDEATNSILIADTVYHFNSVFRGR